jgi:hypothetical protein
MMRIKRWHCGRRTLLIVIVFVASCSRDPFKEQVNGHPRHFEFNGKGYVLNEQEPGVIEDDLVLYTADAGARTFKYSERIVLTQLYVGKWDSFASLTPAQHKETEDLAKSALSFIQRLEQKRNSLSAIDLQHREIFNAFLESELSSPKILPAYTLEKQILEIPSWGGSVPSLLIEVPMGFKLTQRKGPDFDVNYLSSQSAKWDAYMGIYLGHNPNNSWPETASVQSGKAGSFPIVWQIWNEGEQGEAIYHRETLIEDFFAPRHQNTEPPPPKLPPEPPPPPRPPPPPPPPPDPREGLSIHIFIIGKDADAVKAMADWVVTLRKKG